MNTLARIHSIVSAIAVATVATLPLSAQPVVVDIVGQPARAADDGKSTIRATGTSKVQRTPDHVDINLGVVEEATTASEAQAKASTKMESMLKAIKDMKLAGEDLATGAVQLLPVYERVDYPKNPSIIGYQATIMLRIRTNTLTAVAPVIDASLKAGANRIESVQFGIKDAIEAREEAIRLATRAAKRKASVMAEALDLKIVAVMDASASTNQGGYWPMQNRMSQMANIANESQQSGAGESDSPVVPGKIDVWADVSVSFVALPLK